MGQVYKNLIFTDHACQRLSRRSLRREAIYQTLQQPQRKIKLEDDKFKFIKTIRQRRYHVIATYLSQESKWLIISTWVRGEEDRPSLAWQLLSLPFKLIFNCLRFLVKLLLRIMD